MNLFALVYRTNAMKTAAGRAKKIAVLVDMLARGETIVPQPLARGQSAEQRPDQSAVTSASHAAYSRTPMLRSGSIALALTALVALLSIQLRAPELIGPAPEVSGYVPLPPETEFFIAVELEKTRFLQGEQILVWSVTELGSGERRAIPDALLDDQRMIFTRPDGTTRVDAKPVRIDGWHSPDAYGSRYPHTLKRETPQIGRWSAVFEIGTRRTAPAEFTSKRRGRSRTSPHTSSSARRRSSIPARRRRSWSATDHRQCCGLFIPERTGQSSVAGEGRQERRSIRGSGAGVESRCGT
jgi:hypothetical protein